MRLSADMNSPHWRPEATRAKVFLDGAEQRFVIEADDEAGWLVRCEVDAAGNVVPDEALEGVAMETVTGAVRIDVEGGHLL